VIDAAPGGPTLRAIVDIRVAIVGFTAFERSALEASFRLGAARTPAWRLVGTPGEADFVVADADAAAALAAVVSAGRVESTVFVGEHPPPAAQACLPRPVDPLQIERALDAMAGTRAAPAPRAATAPAADVDLLLLDLDATAARPVAGRTGGGGGRMALVVDDAGIARKFLAQRLARLGYTVDTAATSDEALQRINARPFVFVCVDVQLGADDGLALCRVIKAGGRSAPRVVLISHAATGPDRVQGSLAGCDAFVAKPIGEDELIAALRAVDRAFTA
jgi:two-component system cell cycle response regulator